MKAPYAFTIVAFLAFAIEEIAAQDYKEQLKGLPVCAQSCITSGFAKCKCKNLDFTCTCTCRTFRPFSEECSTIACGGQLLKPLLDSLDSTCKSSNAETPSQSSSRLSISETTTSTPLSASTLTASELEPTVVSVQVDTTVPPIDTTIPPIDTTVLPIDTTVLPIDTTVLPIDTTVLPIDKPEASGPDGGTLSVGAGITGTIGGTIGGPLPTDITGSGPESTSGPLLVDETRGLGYTASESISAPTSSPLIVDESRGAGYTMTTSGLYDYSATTTRERYTYCSQGLYNNGTLPNGTASAWNGNATCTYYSVEDFQGGAAARRLAKHLWVSLGTLLLLGLART